VIWPAYIALAGGLAASPSEAARRSAISRAYYGAFNVARRWLEENVEPIENRGAHGQVWETFRRSDRASLGTREEWRLVGELGHRLRLLRNQADYADRIPGLDLQAPRAVLSAEQILALLAELKLADRTEMERTDAT
jgi:hypothetical protein